MENNITEDCIKVSNAMKYQEIMELVIMYQKAIDFVATPETVHCFSNATEFKRRLLILKAIAEDYRS